MPDQTTPFTFLQFSDVHLDSKMSASALALPLHKRQERCQEILQVLLKALELASQKKVDAVLIPGDLWDSESVTSQTVNRLLECLMEIKHIAVIIAPGNHDYCSPDSLYSSAILNARSMRKWPDNVYIFNQSDFSTFRHPARPDVSFTGRAFSGNVQISERLLAQQVPRNSECSTNILLFHGSLDGYDGTDASWPGKRTAPFSAKELGDLNFTYASIGHYHDYTEIRNDSGRLLGAYSGCLVGRTVGETGPRYAILGTIEPGATEARLEKIELDNRRIVEADCDITGLTTSELTAEVEQAIKHSGARQDVDLVILKLEGRHPIGLEPLAALEMLRDRYYHLVVRDFTRPDYLSQKFDRRTTEGKFIQTMLDLKKKAEATGGILDDTEYGANLSSKTIEDALYYGLDALRQKKVVVRHVD